MAGDEQADLDAAVAPARMRPCSAEQKPTGGPAAQRLVDELQRRARAVAAQDRGLQRRAHERGDRRRRGALADDVADHERPFAVARVEDVVEVAADVVGAARRRGSARRAGRPGSRGSSAGSSVRWSAARDRFLLGEQPRVVEREPGAGGDALRELDELGRVAAAGACPSPASARRARVPRAVSGRITAERMPSAASSSRSSSRDALADEVRGRDHGVDLGDARARDGGRPDRRVAVGGLAVGERAGELLLRRVGDARRRSARAAPAVADEVDGAEVGQRGHDRVDERRRARAGVRIEEPSAALARASASAGRARSRPPRSASCSRSAAAWRSVSSTTTPPTPSSTGKKLASQWRRTPGSAGVSPANSISGTGVAGLEHAAQRRLGLHAELAQQLGRGAPDVRRPRGCR